MPPLTRSTEPQACSISRSLMAAPLQRQTLQVPGPRSKHSPSKCQRQRRARTLMSPLTRSTEQPQACSISLHLMAAPLQRCSLSRHVITYRFGYRIEERVELLSRLMRSGGMLALLLSLYWQAVQGSALLARMPPPAPRSRFEILWNCPYN